MRNLPGEKVRTLASGFAFDILSDKAITHLLI